MKLLNISLTLCACILPLIAQSQLPTSIKNLMDKDGVFFSSFNDKVDEDETGTDCRIIQNPYGDEDSITIESVAYFAPVAHLEKAKLIESRAGSETYLLDANGKRPGGSVCGDITPLLSYKKYVDVQDNSLSIRQEYRCLFSSKSIIVQKCSLR